MKFDAYTSSFFAEFIIDTDIKASTEVYINEQIHYPKGFKVSILVNDKENDSFKLSKIKKNYY